MMKKLLVLVLALVLCASNAMAVLINDEEIATLDGAPVYRSLWWYCEEIVQRAYAAADYDPKDPAVAQICFEQALDMTIEYAIMDRKISEKGLQLTAQDIETATAEAELLWEETIVENMRINGIRDWHTEEEWAAMREQVLAELAAIGYTKEVYMEESLFNAKYNKLIDHETSHLSVSDQQAIEYFDSLVVYDQVTYETDIPGYEHMVFYNKLYTDMYMMDHVVTLYYKPEGYKAYSYILLEADEATMAEYSEHQAIYDELEAAYEEGQSMAQMITEAGIAAKAERAMLTELRPVLDDIEKRLAAGESFKALQAQYGVEEIDPATRKVVEPVFEIHPETVMVDKRLVEAALALEKVGDTTSAIVTPDGIFILRYDGVVAGGGLKITPELLESHRQILLDEQRDAVFQDALKKWKIATDISYNAADAQDIIRAREEANK